MRRIWDNDLNIKRSIRRDPDIPLPPPGRNPPLDTCSHFSIKLRIKHRDGEGVKNRNKSWYTVYSRIYTLFKMHDAHRQKAQSINTRKHRRYNCR